MEKEVFIKIIDAIVSFMNLSNGLDKLLGNTVDFGMAQIDEIVTALEIQFEDEAKWIRWWLFGSGEKKIIRVPKPYPPYGKNSEDMWEINEPPEDYKIEVPTAGDLFDLLDYEMANS